MRPLAARDADVGFRSNAQSATARGDVPRPDGRYRGGRWMPKWSMLKLMAFLRSQPQLPRGEVIAHYELRHVPLILSIMPGIQDYRRNFLDVAIGDFDIVTELWFADRASFDLAMSAATQPEAAARIAADEALFLDRSATRFVTVEERRSRLAASSC